MKSKISKKTKRSILIYLVILSLLFIIVEVLPRVTDIFETTRVLEPGTLTLSCETEGWFIKEEAVGTAEKSGDLKYLVTPGTAVKRDYKVISIDPKKKSGDPRFQDELTDLKGFDLVKAGDRSPVSGVFSLSMDGYEDYFTADRMTKIKRETVEGLRPRATDLERDSVIKGEPVFKISNDNAWYVLCWMDGESVKNYQEGREVILKLPDGDVEADVYKTIKEGKDYRVIFHLDVYYETFAETRSADMEVVASDSSGLIVENGAIITKEGHEGVYVKDKNGNYRFKRILVIATDGRESVLRDVSFIDENGERVNTVEVYDEVLRHPKGALEDDLKTEKEDKKE